ncbi:hypothetical protein BX265_4962 [Streptomyces sp. TLI_235]|nr:hypothetical protein [Streptomyces sp. TLI_235]PBC80126.1 hypothetical protein BX265_4962 [Streptomyces sp. TLI_235]
MQPSIGRIVHYTSHGSPVLPDGTQRYKPLPRAAIVTAIPEYLEQEPYDGCPNDGSSLPLVVSLCVFNPTGMFFDDAVPYSEEPTPGCWSWPPRV